MLTLARFRYTDVARIFSGDAHAAAEDGAAIFAQFNRTMEVPGLERWGVKVQILRLLDPVVLLLLCSCC